MSPAKIWVILPAKNVAQTRISATKSKQAGIEVRRNYPSTVKDGTLWLKIVSSRYICLGILSKIIV